MFEQAWRHSVVKQQHVVAASIADSAGVGLLHGKPTSQWRWCAAVHDPAALLFRTKGAPIISGTYTLNTDLHPLFCSSLPSVLSCSCCCTCLWWHGRGLYALIIPLYHFLRPESIDVKKNAEVTCREHFAVSAVSRKPQIDREPLTHFVLRSPKQNHR